MATYFVAKFADQPSFGTLAFRNGLKYRYMDKWIESADYSSTSPTNLVNFGPLNPEITTVEIATFWQREKIGIFPLISQKLAY